jgi:EAL domain-containing protein (putative c-di-GMP-specific phosphodiesterase class I)
MALFEIAAVESLEPDLSRLFRRKGVQLARRLPGRLQLFLNTVPSESGQPELIQSLQDLRRENPTTPMVLEIHEGAVTDAGQMRDLRAALTEIGMGLAYDDFGAGQARVLQLMEAPPDILKFDMLMIRDIQLASARKQQMLGDLVRMVTELQTAALAEGVETREESDKCCELGFQMAQGYYYGRPRVAGSGGETAEP